MIPTLEIIMETKEKHYPILKNMPDKTIFRTIEDVEDNIKHIYMKASFVLGFERILKEQLPNTIDLTTGEFYYVPEDTEIEVLEGRLEIYNAEY